MNHLRGSACLGVRLEEELLDILLLEKYGHASAAKIKRGGGGCGLLGGEKPEKYFPNSCVESKHKENNAQKREAFVVEGCSV